MAKFVIEIEVDNAAFDDYPHQEGVRILRNTIRMLDYGEFRPTRCYETLRDSNGNRVGYLTWQEEA